MKYAMCVQDDHFDRWMRKLSKKLNEIGNDLKSLIQTDTVYLLSSLSVFFLNMPVFLNEILTARRPRTANTALLFEAALGVEADTLMRIQTKYNMQTARKDKSLSDRLTKIRKISAIL
jgi:hypothetical protein